MPFTFVFTFLSKELGDNFKGDAVYIQSHLPLWPSFSLSHLQTTY